MPLNHPRKRYLPIESSEEEDSADENVHAPLNLPRPSLPRPSTGIGKAPLIPSSEGEEDDGAVLQQLLKRYEEMQRPSAEEAQQEGEVLVVGEPLQTQQGGDDRQDDQGDDEEEPLDRRDQAIRFLENLPSTVLHQLSVSAQITHAKQKIRLQKLRKTKRKPDKENSPAEEIEGTIGVVVKLRNRKTGRVKAGLNWAQLIFCDSNDQVISWLDEGPVKEDAQHRLACLMTVAQALHKAILTNTVTTKRDIYYHYPQLYKTQPVVDKLVDDIAASAGLKRQDFNVVGRILLYARVSANLQKVAAAKGLVASSSLKITLTTGEVLSLSSSNPTLIPPIQKIANIDAPHGLEWVLIVEKDAVMTTLCNGHSNLLRDGRVGPGAIVTGKGYPDLATLQLLSRLAYDFPTSAFQTILPQAPLTCPTRARFFALVDADPYGIDIMSTYYQGSRANQFSYDHAGLALGDRLTWLGVKGSEWNQLGLRQDQLLDLKPTDISFATKMLRESTSMPQEWRRELVHMLHLNRKAEIEILQSASGFGRAPPPSQQTQESQALLQDLFGEEVIQASQSQSQSQSQLQSQSMGTRERGRSSGLTEYVVERMAR
ncbi:hypothetical protein P7C73_g5827, partial [Tremellales sp. Uapishka_1]